MQESITYSIDHSSGTADLTLTAERLIARTQGKGLIDKPQVVDTPLAQLKNFCLVPTIAPQNLVSVKNSDGDFTYDSEFIFSYLDGNQLKKKRVFVNSQNESFQALLGGLERTCPGASLLTLQPAEAQKQMGVVSAKKALYLLIGILVGGPLVIALVFILVKALGGK